MGAATETDVSLLESFRVEWASLRLERQNVLLEGPCRATKAMLGVFEGFEMRDSIVCRPTHAFGPSERRSTDADSEERRRSQRRGPKAAARVDWPRWGPNPSHIDE